MDVKLDKVTLKALSSDVRVDALKLLGGRRHMQSELALALGVAVPTMKEHLEALERAGLVERHDEGRKWKYYSLTQKGKGVLYPEQSKIWLLLGVWVFSVVGGVASVLRLFKSAPAVEPAAFDMTMQASVAEESLSLMAKSAPIAPPEPIIWPYLLICAFIAVSALLIVFIVKQKLHQRRLGLSLTKK